MSTFTFIETIPGKSNYEQFEAVPALLYPENSPRFILGHEPATPFLKGCYVMEKAGVPVGRFAFYINPDLAYQGQSTACIGSYECVNDQECSTALIAHAAQLAKAHNLKWLIGPMEGSTWNSYRFSLKNETPNFFMEPYHPTYYNTQFKNAEFQQISTYYSNLDLTLDTDQQTLDDLESEYLSLGGSIRNLRMDDFENEMRKLAQCSIDWFQNNFLYTPISVDEFVAKYSALKPVFNPELVWILEDERGEINAFIFGIQDFWDPTHQTLIIKSVARNPQSKFKRVGTYLGGRINQTAKKMGCTKMIHALMISDNVSLEISKFRTGSEYKSYALYGMKL